MSNGVHPFGRRPVAQLSDNEWRVLMAWRMESVENRLDSLFKALTTLVVMVAVGVLIFVLTSVTNVNVG